MKYIKQPKRHIVLDDFEWRALVKGINKNRKQVIDDDGRVEVILQQENHKAETRQGVAVEYLPEKPKPEHRPAEVVSASA